MKSSRSPTEFDQNNRDVNSIPGYVIKKSSSRGQMMYYQTKQMLEKARQGKHVCHPTILSRWYASELLYDIGWKEKLLMLYDRIASEKHIYVATEAERTQNSNHWILTLHTEGPQPPLNQRPDFAQAKRECKRLYDERLTRTKKNTEPFLAVNK